MTEFKIGDRVRITAAYACDIQAHRCDPAVCVELPAGSLGTVERISLLGGYGVTLDRAAHSVYLTTNQVEAAPGH